MLPDEMTMVAIAAMPIQKKKKRQQQQQSVHLRPSMSFGPLIFLPATVVGASIMMSAERGCDEGADKFRGSA